MNYYYRRIECSRFNEINWAKPVVDGISIGVNDVKMKFIALVRPFMQFSYLFGQTLYPSDYYLINDREWSGLRHFAFVLVPILFFALKIALCSVYYYRIHMGVESLGITLDSLSELYLLCELIEAIALLHQSIAYKSVLANIVRNFQTAESLFQTTMSCPMHASDFGRIFSRKVYLTFGAYMLLWTIGVFDFLNHSRIEYIDVIAKVMQFMTLCTCLHCLFFIEMLTFHLHHLNKSIASDHNSNNVFVVKQAQSTDDEYRLHKQLSNCKFIHYFLWKIAQQINEMFGWMMITLVLVLFCDFVYSTKWTLRTLDEPWNIISFIR